MSILHPSLCKQLKILEEDVSASSIAIEISNYIKENSSDLWAEAIVNLDGLLTLFHKNNLALLKISLKQYAIWFTVQLDCSSTEEIKITFNGEGYLTWAALARDSQGFNQKIENALYNSCKSFDNGGYRTKDKFRHDFDFDMEVESVSITPDPSLPTSNDLVPDLNNLTCRKFTISQLKPKTKSSNGQNLKCEQTKLSKTWWIGEHFVFHKLLNQLKRDYIDADLTELNSGTTVHFKSQSGLIIAKLIWEDRNWDGTNPPKNTEGFDIEEIRGKQKLYHEVKSTKNSKKKANKRFFYPTHAKLKMAEKVGAKNYIVWRVFDIDAMQTDLEYPFERWTIPEELIPKAISNSSDVDIKASSTSQTTPSVIAQPITTWVFGTGRRKRAVARVRIKSGTGQFNINNRPINDYFLHLIHRNNILEVCNLCNIKNTLDIAVNAKGGGTTGQAGAVLLGLARALKEYDPTLEPRLRDNGYLTRDPRKVERKKPGQPGARKRFQFSKR